MPTEFLREIVLPILAVIIGLVFVTCLLFRVVEWWTEQDFKRAEKSIREVGKSKNEKSV